MGSSARGIGRVSLRRHTCRTAARACLKSQLVGGLYVGSHGPAARASSCAIAVTWALAPGPVAEASASIRTAGTRLRKGFIMID